MMLISFRRLSIPIILILISVFVCLSSYAKKDEGEGQDYMDLKKEKVETVPLSRGGKFDPVNLFSFTGSTPFANLTQEAKAEIEEREAKEKEGEKAAVKHLKKYITPLKHSRGDRWPIMISKYTPLTKPLADIYIKIGLNPYFGSSSTIWQMKRSLPMMEHFKKNGMPLIFRPHGLINRAFRKPPFGTHIQHLPPAKAAMEHFPSREGTGHCPAWMYDNPALYSHAGNAYAVCQYLKESGMTPAGIVLDFESGVFLRTIDSREKNVRIYMEESLKCPRCLERFGRENLNTLEKFRDVADKVRAHVIRAGFTAPARLVFPDADEVKLGNYFTYPIRREGKVEGEYPAYGWGGSGLNIATPRCFMPPGFGGAGKNQDNVDWNAFYYCVERFSSCARVLKEDETLVAFVGLLLDHPAGKANAAKGFKIIQSAAYREMVIHTLMRGAETLLVYEGVAKPWDEFPEEYPPDFDRRELGPFLVEVIDVLAAYDEMMAYNDILRKGRVLNYDIKGKYNQLDETTAVWSGVATDKKALIRTVTFGPELVKTVKVFGKDIELPFKREGKFFWVYPDGKVK